MQEPMLTFIDKAWHRIAEDEHTVCGLEVPFGNGFVNEVPDGAKLHCGGSDEADESEAKPKAKAKKAA